MHKWQAELSGHPHDLEELPGAFTEPDLRVITDEGHYYMETAAFDDLANAVDVQTVAGELLRRLNGAALLGIPGFRRVSISGHFREQSGAATHQHAVVLAGTIDVRAKVHAPTILIDGESPPAPTPGPSVSDQRIRKVRSNAHADRAVELWGDPHDTTNLWKVWELIRQYSGLRSAQGQVCRLRTGLNDARASGEAARHEVPDPKYAPHPNPMSVAEAEAFLGDLLKQWLDSIGGGKP